MQFVNLGQAQIITALTSNNGDVAGVWAPNTYTLEEKAGAKYLCSGADAGAIVPGALVVRADFAKEQPEDGREIPRGLSARLVLDQGENQEAREMMKKFYAQGGVEISDKGDGPGVSRCGRFSSLDEQLKIMSRASGASTVDGWFAEIGEFMNDVGTVPANPDAKDYITDEFLKRVAADPKLRAFAK